jgi:YVTN family beta-propeller protein
VTVIDGATNQVITTVATGRGPSVLCYSTQNNKVYCANANNESVTVIDGATDSVLTVVAVGRAPQALCYNSQDNRVYCANPGRGYLYFDSTVTIIDGATDVVITTVGVGNEPWALLYNPKNNKVYCADRGESGISDSTVTVIDGVGDSVLKTIAVGEEPCAFAWNSAQNRVYVANWLGSSISVLRDSGGGVEDSPTPQAVRPKPTATVVRGALFLFSASGVEREASGVLLDISGRKVLNLKLGANDVRPLAPGVYLVRRPKTEDGRPPADISKVVVTR